MAESTSRRGLGRGISALIGETEPLTVPAAGGGEGAGVQETPIELLRRNPDQPRRLFPDFELDELTESIRTHGLLQPILVRPAPGASGEFQIVAGERRWRAAQRAGLRSVPIVVREFNELEILEVGLVENLQREDLNPLEEATAFRMLMDRFGRTQEAVAQAVGKSRSYVANMLRLLTLPENVREYVEAGQLSAGHARAIVSAPNPAGLAKTILDKGLSVRQAEEMAREARDAAEARPKPSRRKGSGGSDTDALAQDLSETLGLAVIIEDRGGKGEVTIKYRTLEQLDDLCRRLSGG
jgi:ParB family chromosome partitioning protein